MGILAPVRSRGAAASVAAHVVVIGVLIYGGRRWAMPIVSPGTASGHRVMLSYLPGRAPAQSLAAAKTPAPTLAKVKTALPKAQKMEPKPETALTTNTSSPVSDHPDATTGADALGAGDISIALAKSFPVPRPDLAPMARGTKGDVVVDITIDEQGKISELKLVNGIESSIDQTVVAAVRQWTFRPASRDGRPVASEQELRFHYEKG